MADKKMILMKITQKLDLIILKKKSRAKIQKKCRF